MAEQVEEEYSEDRRSPKKQRVDDDANEENQPIVGAFEPRVPWRDLQNILEKAVEQMSQKSVQELVGKYSQEIVKSVDILIRPSLLSD
eukprot:g2412.t1